MGTHGLIISFVHGGAFQPNDIERHCLPEFTKAMQAYENGYFSLVDWILLPTQYAQNLFCRQYPDLEAHTRVIPYPLKKITISALPPEKKGQAIYVSRPAWEKGYDIISKCNAVKVFPSGTLNTPEKYFKALSKAIAVVIPARAELYGYVALEAIQCGTIPIVPHDFSYKETIPMFPELKLSSPIGDDTCKEIDEILGKINAMSTKEYNQVLQVFTSQIAHITRLSSQSFHSFFAEIYEK
jgi:hypothetical protein